MNSDLPIIQPTIQNHGILVKHNQACSVYNSNKAVYDMQAGIFQPSWKAQEEGWRLVQAKTPFKRWILNIFFK